jgi:hypothetical protein
MSVFFIGVKIMSNYRDKNQKETRLTKVYLVKPSDYSGELGGSFDFYKPIVPTFGSGKFDTPLFGTTIFKKPAAQPVKPIVVKTGFKLPGTPTFKVTPSKGSTSSTPATAEPKIYTIAGTLGDNLGYYGTGVSVSVIRSDVLRQFKELGWNIQTFEFDWYKDEQQYRFRLTALVNNSYTLEQVKTGATDAFQNFNGGYLGHLFTNVRLDAAAQYVAPSPSANTNSNTGGNSGYVPPSGSTFSLDETLNNLSKNLFGSFGTSTLLIAVVLGGIIVLKR